MVSVTRFWYDLPMASSCAVRLLHKEHIARDTWLFAFEKPKEFFFKPGQYVTITLPLANGKTDSRDMSIASSPLQKELWIVTKKRSPASEFKKILLQQRAGSSIVIEGPAGGFILHEKDTLPKVFFSGGIGITPFYSMLKHASDKKIFMPLTLIASFSSQEEMIFFDELMAIANKNKNITVIYTISHPERSPSWSGEKGRISDKLIQKYIKNIQACNPMIAGSPAMVDDVNMMLLDIGVPLEKIRLDYFTGY